MELANGGSADAPVLDKESFRTCLGWKPVLQPPVYMGLISRTLPKSVLPETHSTHDLIKLCGSF